LEREGTHDRADHADGADNEGEDDPQQVAGDVDQRQAQDQAGDDGNLVALEDIGCHAGAVANIVAHQVGDDGGVARVILGDVLLHLAHQVGAHIGSLGEDAASHSHEQRNEGAAEAEAEQGIWRSPPQGDENDRAPEQAQPSVSMPVTVPE
jgi:hypothetical protein